MLLTLAPHPDTPCDAVSRITVDIHRGASRRLAATYTLVGDTRRIVMPAYRSSGRTDGLWASTCFEVFIRPGNTSRYLEFNFSPSTEWAAYAFDGYRAGMADLLDVSVSCGGRDEGGVYGLIGTVDFAGLTEAEADRVWKIGVSAVIEETGGRKSYWALAHPQGKPDFHHPIAFAQNLPAVVYW
jgi:hypothetical protein